LFASSRGSLVLFLNETPAAVSTKGLVNECSHLFRIGTLCQPTLACQAKTLTKFRKAKLQNRFRKLWRLKNNPSVLHDFFSNERVDKKGFGKNVGSIVFAIVNHQPQKFFAESA
jgi:hypothetical protein